MGTSGDTGLTRTRRSVKQEILAENLSPHTINLKRASPVLPSGDFFLDEIGKHLKFLQASCKILGRRLGSDMVSVPWCVVIFSKPFASVTSAHRQLAARRWWTQGQHHVLI